MTVSELAKVCIDLVKAGNGRTQVVFVIDTEEAVSIDEISETETFNGETTMTFYSK